MNLTIEIKWSSWLPRISIYHQTLTEIEEAYVNHSPVMEKMRKRAYEEYDAMARANQENCNRIFNLERENRMLRDELSIQSQELTLEKRKHEIGKM